MVQFTTAWYDQINFLREKNSCRRRTIKISSNSLFSDLIHIFSKRTEQKDW